MKQKYRYRILSPDRFTIERNVNSYPSIKKANEAFDKWTERYVQQGYYSYRGIRIPLDELADYCVFIEIPVKHRKPVTE